MPKVKYIAVPEWPRKKAAELRERYGRGAISAREFGEELGISDSETIEKWLEGVPFHRLPGSRKRHYLVEDVAKRMHETRHGSEERAWI